MRVLVFVFIVLVFCALTKSLFAQEQYIYHPTETIKLVVDKDLPLDALGTIVDENLAPIIVGGKPQRLAGSSSKTDDPVYTNQFTQIENSLQMKASASILGIVGGRMSSTTNERYGILSAFMQQGIATFNPKLGATTNSQGKFFIKRIYYGWSVNYVYSGSSQELDGEISGFIKSFAGQAEGRKYVAKLKEKIIARGLEVKPGYTEVDRASLQNNIRRSKPVAVFIEYEALTDVYTDGISWEDGKFKPGAYNLSKVTFTIPKYKPSSRNNWDAGLGKFTDPDPVVVVLVDGTEIFRSTTMDNVFEGESIIDHQIDINDRTIVEIQLIDHDGNSGDDFIDSGRFTLGGLANLSPRSPFSLSNLKSGVRIVCKLDRLKR